jgi:hypothetical protein
MTSPVRNSRPTSLLGLALCAASVVAAATWHERPARAAAPAAPSPVQVQYDGTIWYEGHGLKPHAIGVYRSRAIYSANARGGVRVDWSTWKEGDSASAKPETYLVAGDSVFHRDAPGEKWSMLSGNRGHLGKIQAAAGIPSELGRIVKEQSDKNRGEFMFDGSTFLYTEKRAHPRLGDVVDSVGYSYAVDPKTPEEILISLHERDAQWRMSQRLVGTPTGAAPDSLFLAPRTFDPERPEIDFPTADVKLVQRAPGIWTADLDDIESRSMIVEFSDHVAILEMAVGSANGERLVDAAKRQFPGKPIRYALFSHHHPHYLGGLRAAMAEGATIVTTPGNEAYIKEIASYPFTIQPDRLAKQPTRPVKVRTFTDRIELADAANQLIAINYGERSNHTQEFVIFYFPRQKLIFEAEQGWITVDGVLKATRRAATLTAWIAEQKLDVEQLIQSWPMRGEPAEVSLAKLSGLIPKPTPKPIQP